MPPHIHINSPFPPHLAPSLALSPWPTPQSPTSLLVYYYSLVYFPLSVTHDPRYTFIIVYIVFNYNCIAKYGPVFSNHSCNELLSHATNCRVCFIVGKYRWWFIVTSRGDLNAMLGRFRLATGRQVILPIHSNG